MARPKAILPPEPDDYNRGKKRYLVIQSIQRQNDIIALLLEGKDTQKDIAPYICKKYKTTHKTASFYIQECKNIIKSRKNSEIQTLLSIHIQRYEEIYQYLYAMGAYSWASNALKAKERLLGFHKEGFHMRVSSGQLTSIVQVSVDNEYDVGKLTSEKRDLLSRLMQKAKKAK